MASAGIDRGTDQPFRYQGVWRLPPEIQKRGERVMTIAYNSTFKCWSDIHVLSRTSSHGLLLVGLDRWNLGRIHLTSNPEVSACVEGDWTSSMCTSKWVSVRGGEDDLTLQYTALYQHLMFQDLGHGPALCFLLTAHSVVSGYCYRLSHCQPIGRRIAEGEAKAEGPQHTCGKSNSEDTFEDTGYL